MLFRNLVLYNYELALAFKEAVHTASNMEVLGPSGTYAERDGPDGSGRFVAFYTVCVRAIEEQASAECNSYCVADKYKYVAVIDTTETLRH